MTQFNDFGKDVKKRLIDINQNQEWLMEQIRIITGKYVDSSYMAKLMQGKITSAPMVETIKEILGI